MKGNRRAARGRHSPDREAILRLAAELKDAYLEGVADVLERRGGGQRSVRHSAKVAAVDAGFVAAAEFVAEFTRLLDHGTFDRWLYGCRCGWCVAAARVRWRARRQADPPRLWVSARRGEFEVMDGEGRVCDRVSEVVGYDDEFSDPDTPDEFNPPNLSDAASE